MRLLKTYLHRTSSVRNVEAQLLLRNTKPHGEASKDTISRWIKTFMLKTGVDTSLFKPHSLRSAATSAAHISIFEILATARWHSSSVFGKYYDKPVLRDGAFANSALTGASNGC